LSYIIAILTVLKSRAVKVPYSKELVPVTSFSKVTRSSYKERVPKVVIITSSYSAEKGTYVTSYTLLLHEKIATFILKTLLRVA